MRCVAVVFSLLAALARGGAPQVQPSRYISEEMDRWLMEGIDDIYRMRFDDAEAAARRAIAISPDHPHAYLGLAGVSWTRYVYGTDQGDLTLLAEFDARTKKTIEVGERWAAAHPDDGQGLMTLGAAYGLASRLSIIRHQWVRGYFQGRKAIQITRAAVKAEPELWDAYLGIGMYDYYTDVYPRFIGALAKIVLRGDRLRGIKSLELVADKGHYSKANAMILLVEIFTEDRWGARDPKKAIELMQELRARYPDSAMMHSAQLVALYEGRRFHEAADSAREYVRLVDQGRYNAIEAGKGYVALGCALWQLGQRAEALEAFKKAQAVDFQGKPSRWAVWARIRAAQLEDAMGRRADALADYKFAADLPDVWDFKQFAKTGLAKAFSAITPGPIPPP